MDKNELILVKAFCKHYHIEMSFVNTLHEFNLIEVVQIDEDEFVPQSQLPELEKMIRLHQELNINPEGLDAVLHLLQKLQGMQREIDSLKSRLKIYE
ncbi:chaperone modulator CbpM [Flavobacterium sp. NRK1]|uniref:chaperone modulator CbpM n=1 Tax=Flavobacterium sp. NRK1 TaxID=2954929 RepID=UPI00209209FB|nr:chaperone modulator CbpM [Flavobacterium sp. NRK1]MCO6149689.1 chaperone modulator CbpM [Flavobacterium sp. NRK1]